MLTVVPVLTEVSVPVLTKVPVLTEVSVSVSVSVRPLSRSGTPQQRTCRRCGTGFVLLLQILDNSLIKSITANHSYYEIIRITLI
ncbi:MAG: hypothetical protein ACM3PT_04905 [Deltaproteobacteria bacterium]